MRARPPRAWEPCSARLDCACGPASPLCAGRRTPLQPRPAWRPSLCLWAVPGTPHPPPHWGSWNQGSGWHPVQGPLMTPLSAHGPASTATSLVVRLQEEVGGRVLNHPAGWEGHRPPARSGGAREEGGGLSEPKRQCHLARTGTAETHSAEAAGMDGTGCGTRREGGGNIPPRLPGAGAPGPPIRAPHWPILTERPGKGGLQRPPHHYTEPAGGRWKRVWEHMSRRAELPRPDATGRPAGSPLASPSSAWPWICRLWVATSSCSRASLGSWTSQPR